MNGAASPALAAAGATPLTDLPGIGSRLAEKFAARGFSTLQDLWLHLPLRYVDRTRVVPIAQARPGSVVQIEGKVEAVECGFRWRPSLRVMVSDADGDTLVLRFIHFRAGQVAQFRPGVRLRAYGGVRLGARGPEMVHPSYRLLRTAQDEALPDRLEAVYPAVEGIGATRLARCIGLALDRLPADDDFELLPADLRARWQLPGLREALLRVHRPGSHADARALAEGRDPGQRRLVLEELLAHHLSLRRQRMALQALGAVPLPASQQAMAALRTSLPFALTAAQARVLAEVFADLQRPRPMLRLIQGDVGSGKTVIAAFAALAAIAAGRQAALMAPTELLAEQHCQTLRAWLEPLGVRIVWLAGRVTGKARRKALDDIARGQAQLVVGTHALMQGSVRFADLALCIIDEQHRFGVHQRLALRDKGREGNRVPHQLVLTATPIPRTLAMTAYADLDVSVLDQLPPGRSPVQTVAISGERRAEVIERIRVACAQGRQAYWVCVLIDDSDEVQAQAAQRTYETLCAQLPELRIGLVHGRMKSADKQAVMRAFKDGELHLLVATTVIEVGVDVPNASLMLIDNAERLGLAQLHQLRGRVGRGTTASTCVLLYQPPLSARARERLAVLRASNDGFAIAEKDLELRGPGELLGTRQTGMVQFRLADLARDASLLPEVQALAEEVLARDPTLADRLVARWVGSAVRFAGA